MNPAIDNTQLSNFQYLATGLDVNPLLISLNDNKDLWNQFPVRTMHEGTAHSDASDILIRFNRLSEKIKKIADDNECYWYPAASELPVLPYINELFSQVMGDRIGRVIITSLPPGGEITSHSDYGAPVEYYQRFHITIQNASGSVFYCGDESITASAGDVFIFDNSKEHRVVNNSSVDRITMIVDIRTPRFEHIKKTWLQFKQPVRTKLYPAGISYQDEKFEDCLSELKEFAPIHHAELGLTPESVPLDMDWDRFIDMEETGRLHMLTVRDSGKLIGYHISFVTGHYHYKSTLHASVDLYYLKQEYRKSKIGLNLFIEAEKSLKKIGVVKIITGCKKKLDHTPLFEKLGYELSDLQFMKIIG